MKRSIRHEFVKIFGGTYYDDKNHEIASCYSYAGTLPLWINHKIYRLKFRGTMLWYDIQILSYKIVIYIQDKFKNKQ